MVIEYSYSNNIPHRVTFQKKLLETKHEIQISGIYYLSHFS